MIVICCLWSGRVRIMLAMLFLLACIQRRLFSSLLWIWWNGPWLTLMVLTSCLTIWMTSHIGTPHIWCLPVLFLQLCYTLTLPLHPDKLEGLTTCLTILGIELDFVKVWASRPQHAYSRHCIARGLVPKAVLQAKELQSLISHLHHACNIAPQGRTFPGTWQISCVHSSVMTIPSEWTGSLMDRYRLFLMQGLAPSTRRVYLSAQRRYVVFCC